MKITFNKPVAQETEKIYKDTSRTENIVRRESVYGADFVKERQEGWLPQKRIRDKGKSLAELQQEAANKNTAVQQDYMTVLANTMSKEDYAKLQEDGFSFENMDPDTAVTIVDKIKAELARSGKHIAGYTDDLDVEMLSAALGNEALAQSVSKCFSEADIPLTEENIEAVSKAWDMASALVQPGEGVARYMTDNGLEPTIWNLYVAQSSGAGNAFGAVPSYYAEDVQGYYTRSAQTAEDAGLKEQAERVIADAGMEINEWSREAAHWLVENGLPLTEESLLELKELKELEFPISVETFAKAAAAAIASGSEPVYANLACTESIYERAAGLADAFFEKNIRLSESGDITARRQLEEIRLRMTAEVNLKLLKSDFSIDTASMEQLIDALKQAEAELATEYFPGDVQAEQKYVLYRETVRLAEELPDLPAQLLGKYASAAAAERIAAAGQSVEEFYAEGKALQEQYGRAQESYEALMTVPRADMGDSIRKAFANVDAILTDLGLELNKENQRAARILSYNRMPMTAENIERVKEADKRVQSVVCRLTPKNTLQMIRDGINPLEKTFEQLQEYFDTLPVEEENETESYSRFLYRLEQNKEITEQERTAYIGVYRMLRQIEKSDGAAVGAVVSSQAELQFDTLLTAVRTGRFKHMDVRATDEIGLLQKLVRSQSSISEQIGSGIRGAAEEISAQLSDREIEQAYDNMQLERLREAAGADEETVALLQRGQLPQNAGNILAAQALVYDWASPYSLWKEKQEQMLRAEGEESIALESLWESLEDKEGFSQSYAEGLAAAAHETHEAALQYADNSMDVRQLKLIHKQLSVAGALSSAEDYILPMYIGDSLAKVHLTFDSDVANKGTLHIGVDFSADEHVEAQLQVRDGKIGGFLVGNTPKEVTKLKNAADIFVEFVENTDTADWKVEKLPIVSSASAANPVKLQGSAEGSGADNQELYRLAKLFLQALKNF